MGLGEVGRAIARAVLATPNLSLVGAVDPARGLAGRALAEVLGVPAPDLVVGHDPAGALQAARGGVILHAVTSSFQAALPDLERAVQAGCSVVSTCEELAWPWMAHEAEAQRLDELCEAHQVAVVGTGVNPGLALDRLPVVLAQAAGEVRHVLAVRVVDVARRRDALRRKAGVGLGQEAFDAAAERGEVGHTGLPESAALVAVGCGLELDEVDEELTGLVAEEDGPGVARGQVAGVHQVARAYLEDREIVRLELTLALGVEDPRDEVTIDGDPPLRLVVPGGIPGDRATAWAVVHAAAAVVERRGLLTVLDLPAGR
jgi:4-hydroxy-tetrahydrodipicolinate reductase